MQLHRNEKAQGMVEYSLLILLIALVVIITLTLLGTQLSTVFSQIANSSPFQ